MSPSPRELDAMAVAAVHDQLRLALADHRDLLGGIAPEVRELVDALEQHLQGGKLLRPRFCFWGGAAVLDETPGPQQVTALARYGAAVELVQSAALLHDDVIDHSPTRRGRPAAHVAAARRHREQGLSGSSDAFGEAFAIVLGDLALSWAEQLAAAAEAPGGTVPSRRARAEFDLLRTEVMSGQYLDILHQAGGFTSAPSAEDAATAVIRWKTVPYTVARPVRIGAALMGAGDDALAALQEWAVAVGTAFQLRDDLLSVVGDQDATGKPTGGDIREGKRTVVLARTLESIGDRERRLLERVVGNPAADPADVERAHQMMVASSAVRSVREDVDGLAAHAEAVLDRAPGLSAHGVEGLRALARAATDLSQLPDG